MNNLHTKKLIVVWSVWVKVLNIVYVKTQNMAKLLNVMIVSCFRAMSYLKSNMITLCSLYPI